MAASLLYLFPDTNLFEQGCPLDQIDWSSLGNYHEIELIVVRPVQAEIDRHKNQGSSRLAARARATSTMLREIILSPDKCKIVREASPRVKLLIRQELRPKPEFGERLDYQTNDDQLVGTIAAFIEKHPNVEAKLLTHDTGPMASADMVGVPFLPVPDEWLLPPERSADEKEILRLNTELARLKKAEPEFSLVATDIAGKKIERMETEYRFYDALSPSEIEGLMGLILERNPSSNDFGSREPQERPSFAGLSAMIEKFTPASDEEIDIYKRVTYPSWAEECRKFLVDCHVNHFVDPLPPFCFVAKNIGTRPAKDALIEISAKGDFLIAPIRQNANQPGDKEPNQRKGLPQPPQPPRGTWSRRSIGYSIFDQLGRREMATATPVFPRLTDFYPEPRDPNEFYWKPKKPSEPVSAYGYECAQWRHAGAPEPFHGQIYIDRNNEGISGAVAFSVHAENMSSVAEIILPIRIVITKATAIDLTRALVDKLNLPRFRGFSVPPINRN